jgi:hypothetical protein
MIKPHLLINKNNRLLRGNPETDVPVGNASIEIVSDVLRVANNPSQVNRWYGRPVMKHIGYTNSGIEIWICCYANSESHPSLVWSQLHLIFSNDYGETWTDENIYLDGSPVTGTPIYPPTCPPGENSRGPGDGWIMVCPNGDLLIHMWDANYQSYDGGTYQTRSTDKGRTWSTPELVTWVNNTGIAISGNEHMMATDDDFVLNGVIYCGIREMETTASYTTAIRSWIAKSEDNGVTWELVSKLSNYSDVTNEFGFEYVGNNRVVACVRQLATLAYLTKSYDFMQTWDGLTQIQSSYGIWSRPRLKTRSHCKNKNNWWLDPVVIMHGFEHITSGSSTPRRIAVWISKDRGDTFEGPHYLRIQGFDGGYGDFLYNPIKDEYVTMQYYAPTSYYDGEVRQINWKLTFV